MSLIPQTPGTTPGYWCTWNIQNNQAYRAALLAGASLADCEGPAGAKLARDAMCEQAIFGEGGWATQFEGARGDLYLVLDDGWDVPFGTHPDADLDAFGSLVLAADRFPSFPGSPMERLARLNERVKQAGWRGLGLWVAAQCAGADVSEQAQEEYVRERARWCRFAQVHYWKVDWGKRGADVDFRRMVTRVAREECPEIVVEHSAGCGPLNGFPWAGSNRFADWAGAAQRMLDVQAFSDVVRSYDVTAALSTAATLDRLATLLADPCGSLVNCEDELVMGAALGCTLGVMRSEAFAAVPGMANDPQYVNRKIDEVRRTARWQRVAPAFAGTGLMASEDLLTDVHVFKAGETWMSEAVGKRVTQTAPAILVRNMRMPWVRPVGVQPFVVAAQNAVTGAYTMASLGRMLEMGYQEPKAHVTVVMDRAPKVMGLFGRYASVTLRVVGVPGNARAYARDMLGGERLDVTPYISACGNEYSIPGDLLEKVGLAFRSPGDLSVPGVGIEIV